MSSTDDATSPGPAESSTGKFLVPVSGEPAASAAYRPSSQAGGFDSLAGWRRIAVPAALVVLAGVGGWQAGAHSSSRTASIAASDRAASEMALVADLKAQAESIEAMAARLKALEGAPKAEASLKPAIEILARRIDEIARTQTAALTQTSARLDRSDKDMGARLDRLGERMERVEKQVSSSAPVSTVPKTAAAQPPARPAAQPDPQEQAEEADAKPIRGYVLRDVFRGGALVESRHGLVEVFPGAQLPGAGRVRSVERRDGRWVVVTTAGLIEAR